MKLLNVSCHNFSRFSTLLGGSWAVWEFAKPRDCSHVVASGWQSLLADRRTQAHDVNLVLLFSCSGGQLLRVSLKCSCRYLKSSSEVNGLWFLTGMFCLFLLLFCHCMNFVNATILPHSYSLMSGKKHSCRCSVSVTKENINSTAISRDFWGAETNTDADVCYQIAYGLCILDIKLEAALSSLL